MRATCPAVPARPTASSRASVAGVATRVSSRTFEYESSPRARAWARRGRVPRARATRTCSRAAPAWRPIRQVSQAAQELKPEFHPPRASKSRMRASRRAVAASRWAANSAISSPSRSSSRVVEGAGVISMGASPLSAGVTLHPGFGALWEARQAANRVRSGIFARPSSNVALCAWAARRDAFQPALPAGDDGARTSLSSGIVRKCA